MITVKVLGSGCAKCNKLFDLAKKVAQDSGIEADVTKVEDLDDIMNYGVMMTPALVVNEEVKSTGKIPKPAQIEQWLAAAEQE